MFDVDVGDILINNDFGFYNPSARTIRDRVWFDGDADGDDDVGPDDNAETGICDVTVDLLDASRNVVASTRTDDDGYFQFGGVLGAGADYTIRITDAYGKLKDYYGTTTGAVAGEIAIDNLDGDIDFTTRTIPTGPTALIPISGTIWRVRSATRCSTTADRRGGTAGNGVQDGDEPGIGGVEVLLYADLDGDGAFEPGGDDGGPEGSTATDTDGTYLFSGLDDGRYFISIDGTQSVLDGFSLTSADESSASGHQQMEIIDDGFSNLNADFGYRADIPRTISGTIWEDDNENGIIDGGELRLEDVTLELSRAGRLMATATTDASGNYAFVGTAQGTYTVKVTDKNEILAGFATTWEDSEGLDGPYNDQETVDTTSGDASGINFGYLNPKPTSVLVSSFGAFEADGRFVVEWETASEIGTLGFYLYRQEADGEYRKVNDAMIPAVVVQHGGQYRCVDPLATPGVSQTYRLAEIEISGGPTKIRPLHCGDRQPLPGARDRRSGRPPEARIRHQLQGNRLHAENATGKGNGKFRPLTREAGSLRPFWSMTPP